MIENIFIGLIIILAIGMGIWGWWIDNVGIKKKEEVKEEQETEQESGSVLEKGKKKKDVKK